MLLKNIVLTINVIQKNIIKGKPSCLTMVPCPGVRFLLPV